MLHFYFVWIGEGTGCAITGIWGLFGCDLYTRRPNIPHTIGAKSRGNISAINCSKAKSESPIKPRRYPTTLVAENTFLVFDITRSMRKKLSRGAYNAVFFDERARNGRVWLPVHRIAHMRRKRKTLVQFYNLSISSCKILSAPRRFWRLVLLKRIRRTARVKSHQSSQKSAEVLPLIQKHGNIAKTNVAFAKLRCHEEVP